MSWNRVEEPNKLSQQDPASSLTPSPSTFALPQPSRSHNLPGGMESSVPVALGCDKPRGHSQAQGHQLPFPGQQEGSGCSSSSSTPCQHPQHPSCPQGPPQTGAGGHRGAGRHRWISTQPQPGRGKNGMKAWKKPSRAPPSAAKGSGQRGLLPATWPSTVTPPRAAGGSKDFLRR